MRTTVDLPDDLHDAARSIARDRGTTLSETVADLIRRGLGLGGEVAVARAPKGELPVVRIGRVITQDDVRSLDDE